MDGVEGVINFWILVVVVVAVVKHKSSTRIIQSFRKIIFAKVVKMKTNEFLKFYELKLSNNCILETKIG